MQRLVTHLKKNEMKLLKEKKEKEVYSKMAKIETRNLSRKLQ